MPDSSAPTPSKRPRANLYRNWVTYCGAGLTTIGLVLVLMGMLFQVFSRSTGPYAGLVTFVLFPVPAVIGVILVLGGMWRESRRRKREHTTLALPYPSVDLNDPRQRRIFEILVVATSVVFAVLAVAGYNGFEVTESPGFCGNACHTPMGPEMTAYKDSPHARVPCVACHVGEGAEHYVASKLNGMKQLKDVVFHSYDRPIPAPVKALRPARETCETCHWPRKFWGSTLYQRPLFRYDEANTPEQITMLVRTGGGAGSFDAGIHWHMVVDNEVEYVADDAQLQEIPWVRLRGPDGKVTEYFRTDKPIEPARVATMQHHEMDCIDCHNRPSHTFQMPDVAVDSALARGLIPPTLPWVKTVAVGLLSRDFPTSESAHEAIRKDLVAYYAEKYPDVAKTRAADLDTAVRGVIAIFDRNVFPDMNVSWKTYPDNIGHRNSAGCFRCHDGRHVAADGSVITHECTACHTQPKRGPLAGMGDVAVAGDADWHPWQMPQKYLEISAHKTVLCHECHVAGRKPKTECNECHSH